jgi:hypothetical protein
MQDSYSELYQVITRNHCWIFRTSHKKKGDEILHLYLKEVNSIPKEYRQDKLSSKGFFDEITVQVFQSVDIRYTFTSHAEDGLMKILGKLFIEIEFSSRRNSGNTGVRVF